MRRHSRQFTVVCQVPNTHAPASSSPRVKDFDVPPLQEVVNPDTDEAIVATLDIAPSTEWLAIFAERVGALQGDLGLAAVEIVGADIRFFGSVHDARRLADRVRALVDDVTSELKRRG